jgi:hypothetical protein
MHSDKLRAIWKRRLNLNIWNHLCDTFHHILPSQNIAARTHEFGNGFAEGLINALFDAQSSADMMKRHWKGMLATLIAIIPVGACW